MNKKLKTSCLYDLSFPYHQPETADQKLTAIQAFTRNKQLASEYLLQGEATHHFEQQIATMLGKTAAMWCSTGTMAQAIAARIHADNRGNKTILLHPTSHLLLHENDGYQQAHGLAAQIIGEWNKPLFAEALDAKAACAFIELPQRHNGGLLPNWQALTAIKHKASELSLPLHMDGARIWSCRSYYDNRSFAQIADGFSSVYVSLYKDIGAMGGAFLIGDDDFIAAAKIWRHRLGGLMIEAWPLIFDAMRLLEKRLEQMPPFVIRAKQLAAMLTSIEKIQVTPNTPQVNMFHIQLPCSAAVAESLRDETAKQTGVWLGNRFWAYNGDKQCALEIIVGEKAAAIPDELFLKAISTMVNTL